MKVLLPSIYILTFTIVFSVKEGLGILDSVEPPSGTLIADFEGTENATTIICNVTNSIGSRTSTSWFVENFRGLEALQLVGIDFAPELFSIGGDLRPTDPTRTFLNHFTIVNFTSELDNVMLYCGTGINRQQAEFSLRVYRGPSIADNVLVTVLEGTPVTVDNLEMEPKAFPFPTFRWTRNSVGVMNVSGSVYFGYPAVIFSNVSRNDTGTYSIFAENSIIDGDEMIGNDTGSFILDVLYGPEIIAPLSDSFAVLENGNVTLICGTSLSGNPTPTVEWFTNTGDSISDSQVSERVSVSNVNGVVSLTLYGANLNDTGVWRCAVSSNLTTTPLERNLSLTILVPPSEPLNVTILSFGATWIEVSWLQPEFMGVPAFTLFVITAEPTNTTNANSLAMLPPQNVNVTVDRNFTTANVTQLFPGEEYRLSITAASENSNERAVSNSSEAVFIFTNTTAPEVVCLQTPISERGSILLNWDYLHTGGLNLTQVSIEYRQGQVENFQPLPERMYRNEDLRRTKKITLLNFIAGFEYVFRVTGSNENGSDSIECPPVEHMIGVPQQPTINGIASTSPGEASLDVSTPEGGVAEGDTLLFVVESQLVDSVDMSISLLEVSNYVDSMVTTLTVNRLTPGMEYRFRVRVQNQFGTSTYSDTAVQQISISESSVSASVIGGVISGVVVVILLVLVTVVIIVLLIMIKTRNRSRRVDKSKPTPSEEDLIDNELYDFKDRKGKDIGKGDDETEENIEDVHYAAIPTVVATKEQNQQLYESMTPTPHVKQSDNPLYSSTQDLRRSMTIPSRGTSQENINSLSARSTPVPSFAAQNVYAVPQPASRQSLDSGGPTNQNSASNRLSYGFEREFELSNRQIPPARHTRSLSQGYDPLYTEL